MSLPITHTTALLDLAKRDPTFIEFINNLGHSAVNLIGPSDGLKSYLALAAGKAAGKPVCLITADAVRARVHAESLNSLLEDSNRLQIWKTRDYGWTPMDAAGRESEHGRLSVLSALLRKEVDVLLIPGAGLLQPIPDETTFRASCVTVTVTEGHHEVVGTDAGKLGPEGLLDLLIAAGYERTGRAENAGQVARRGDIVDVVPIGLSENVFGSGEGIGWRISYFDTEVDLIRSFDIATQRSLENLESIVVPPAREVLVPALERSDLAEKIRRHGQRRVKELAAEGASIKARNDLEELCSHDADMIEGGRDFPGLDRWLSYIYPELTSILDYAIAEDFLIFVDEPATVRKRIDGFAAEEISQLRNYMNKGQTVALAEKAIINPARPFQELDRLNAAVSLAAIGGSGNGFPGAEALRIVGRDTDSYRGRETQLVNTLCRRQEEGLQTYLATASAERQQKLAQLCSEADATAEILSADLPRGFEYPAAKLLVIGSQDIFGSDRKRRRRRSSSGIQGQKIDLFSDLAIGEAVVHEAYGIGRYEGLANLESGGVRKDYLKIAYSGDDVVYLPMKQLDQIQKYIGSGDKKPKLSKLGGKDWSRLKERARNSIRTLATDLVALYAKRQNIKGFIFPEDTPWDDEFAATFPYEETEDQLRCIREIKGDMESDKVMDRLLCGDVGFGKTEVAFRAMFKAVMGGKQAALLAPTTVLTQQHYANFIERIADFPVRVGLLSRFANKQQMAHTVRGLASGEIDVVIGTHRLLSDDVKFKDLGLLVVDEEQRFGVDHKEKLKNISPQVDVLTLSATPIPRTLHMSMAGIRDISIIEEPPEDRRSVQTYVMEFDEELLIEGISRELEREGQVFYLFNDTRHIYEKATRIQEAIPGSRTVVAHGKMPERQLESVIESFIMGEADVLVCTTIIESGIDMPNVNTIIVENADRMGLAQLYQLRGRVGRSGRQAYAYITYQKNKVISEESAKRLAAIRDYTELGAGFRIALRDLEVRGAGNLLGGEQHGQMDAIGYDLYVRMLEEEIKNIQAAEAENEPVAEVEPLDTVVDIPIDAYLTSDYIPDEGERIDIYRRISMIRNMHNYNDLMDELTDRYGDVPLAAVTLADLSYVRAQANQCGFSKISLQKNAVVMTSGRQTKSDLRRVSLLLDLPAYKGLLVFNVSGETPDVRLRGIEVDPLKMPAILRKMFNQLERAETAEAAAAAAAAKKETGAASS